MPMMLLLLLFSVPSELIHTKLRAAHADSRTRQPIVTGTSVLALKYKDGIMMAADNLGTVHLDAINSFYR